jgi:hypothetical protein
VQEWLGHESLATTQKYLEPSKETDKQLEDLKLCRFRVKGYAAGAGTVPLTIRSYVAWSPSFSTRKSTHDCV